MLIPMRNNRVGKIGHFRLGESPNQLSNEYLSKGQGRISVQPLKQRAKTRRTLA